MSSLKSEFKKPVVILLAVIFIFLVVSRLAFLSEKPFHHDESQYALFSLHNFKGAIYKYDPILHGPLLFYINVILYFLFGVSDFVARLGPALFGILVPLVFLLMRRWTGTKEALILAILYSASPSFTYFNRFLSHDTYVAFFSVLVLLFFSAHALTKSFKYIYYTAIALAFLFMVKVSAYIYSFIFLSFLFFLFFKHLPGNMEDEKSLYLKNLKTQKMHLILGTVLFFSLFFIFYSCFFMHPKGFIDGLFLKSLGYWAGQNAVQRIKGPFDYHLPIIATYELPVIMVCLAGFFMKIFRRIKISVATVSALLFNIALFFVVTHFWDKTVSGGFTLKHMFDSYLHMQSAYHLPLALTFIYTGVIVVLSHIKEKENTMAFFAWWLFLSLLIYSYAGEKVPWLSLNILMPMLFYASALTAKFLRSAIFRTRFVRISALFAAAVIIVFTLFINYRVSIKNPSDAKERLVFVQTCPEIVGLVKEVERLAEKTRTGIDLKLSVNGESGWPLNWYLREFKSIYPAPYIGDKNNMMIIVDEKDLNRYKDLKKDFDMKIIPLRAWWVPDMRKKVSFKKLIDYYLYRKVWSVTGHQDIAVFTKRGE